MTSNNEIAAGIKELMVERLRLQLTPADISDTQPLFGDQEGSLGLDSVEALELAVAVEEKFGVHLDEAEAVEHFYSVATLSAYVESLRQLADSADRG